LRRACAQTRQFMHRCAIRLSRSDLSIARLPSMFFKTRRVNAYFALQASAFSNRAPSILILASNGAGDRLAGSAWSDRAWPLQIGKPGCRPPTLCRWRQPLSGSAAVRSTQLPSPPARGRWDRQGQPGSRPPTSCRWRQPLSGSAAVRSTQLPSPPARDRWDRLVEANAGMARLDITDLCAWSLIVGAACFRGL
jgi:hypothetical protein